MSRHVASPARLEAFSDGVIAVIITIMVLELKVPHQDGLAGLYSVLPTLAIYLLSFTFTSIYWINHHHLVHRTDEADTLILYANLAFLFSLSLLPFFTSYVLDKKMDSLSVAIYAGSMIANAITFMGLRLAIGRRLKQAGKLEYEDTAVAIKHWLSMFIYVVAIPTAFHYPHFTLGMIALVTVIWITPTAGVKPHADTYPRNT
ncbi:TMEM175 family protein [Granulicella arctica]|uniref:TMEM175 family protein n=1 Tax=Granulicella arctica TaxID=940613 RepID=UPI0021E09EFA|nr:TMEM175 family protein [Granulicella arctica]